MFRHSRIKRLNAVFVIPALILFSVHCRPSGTPSALKEEESLKIEYSLEPGAVLKYKGTSSREMNFYGMNIRTVHTDRVTLTMREKTEDGNNRIRIRYDKTSDQLIRSGEMEKRSNPVNPEGRTVEVDVSPAGEVKEARGVIPGLPEGGLKDYVSKWFAELPEEALSAGELWEEDISDTTESSRVKGKMKMTMEGVGEENGIRVAYISGDVITSVERQTRGGNVKGEANADVEAAIALEGGYVVNYKMESEFKGTATGINPETAKEETSEVSQTSYTTVELIK